MFYRRCQSAHSPLTKNNALLLSINLLPECNILKDTVQALHMSQLYSLTYLIIYEIESLFSHSLFACTFVCLGQRMLFYFDNRWRFKCIITKVKSFLLVLYYIFYLQLGNSLFQIWWILLYPTLYEFILEFKSYSFTNLFNDISRKMVHIYNDMFEWKW